MASPQRPLRPVVLVLEKLGHGGTEVYVEMLAKILASHYQIVIVALRDSRHKAKTSKSNLGHKTIVISNKFFNFFSVLRIFFKYRHGTIHLHLYTSKLKGALAARLVGADKLVSTFHMPLTQWHWRHRLAWRLAAALSDVCVGVSSDCVNSFTSTARRRSWYVIPASLPIDRMPEKVRYRDNPSQSLLIAGSGRLAREKDWPTLLRALGKVRATGDVRPKLWLFGDGVLRNQLEKLSDELGISPVVTFHGYFPRNQMLMKLCETDLFVLPSLFEGLGLSAVEAMALGLPTITADFPSSADFIRNSETGHCFPRGDVDALCMLIRWHLEHPPEAAQIGLHGKKFAKTKFSVKNTFDEYFQIL